MRIAVAIVVVTGCTADAGISWGPVSYGEAPREPSVRSATLPQGGAGCAGVVLSARGDERYAAWWEAGANNRSVLMLARSPDGGAHWETPIVADDRDRGGLGCGRPGPSLFADDRSEYLHLTYHISPEGSPGVYFTHSMKASALARSGEGVLHMPVAVTYGQRPVPASVAGRGDTVVVAFEDPNTSRRRILLSYSTGAGHTFSPHVAVSLPGAAAHTPRVTLSGDSVRVQWIEDGAAGSRRAASRAGRLP